MPALVQMSRLEAPVQLERNLRYCEIQEVKASMRKQQIKNLLIDYFVDDEIFEEKYLDKKKEIHSSDDETLLKIKQLDLEILKLESEAKIE